MKQRSCARQLTLLAAAALAAGVLPEASPAPPENADTRDSAISDHSLNQPAADYVLHCQGCHGPQGAAVQGKVPPLARAMGHFMRSAAGRDYVLRVPGVANSALSDERLAAVLNWVAEYFDPGYPKGELRLFTATEVSRSRHRPLASVLAARREVVRDLAATGPAPPMDY